MVPSRGHSRAPSEQEKVQGIDRIEGEMGRVHRANLGNIQQLCQGYGTYGRALPHPQESTQVAPGVPRAVLAKTLRNQEQSGKHSAEIEQSDIWLVCNCQAERFSDTCWGPVSARSAHNLRKISVLLPPRQEACRIGRSKCLSSQKQGQS